MTRVLDWVVDLVVALAINFESFSFHRCHGATVIRGIYSVLGVFQLG